MVTVGRAGTARSRVTVGRAVTARFYAAGLVAAVTSHGDCNRYVLGPWIGGPDSDQPPPGGRRPQAAAAAAASRPGR